MKALLASWAALAVLAGVTHADSDPYGLAEVYGAMNYDDTHTRIEWTDCGEINAFYSKKDRTVYLCNELKPLPAPVIRFITAHELAHGVIDQRDVPITGSDETAADELAAITLIAAGHVEDVRATAYFFRDLDTPENPFDEHPSAMRRAVALMCYVMEDGGVDPALCPVDLHRSGRSWARLLHLGEYAPK